MVRTTADGQRNRVRAARRAAELTQVQLAQAVDVSRQTIVAIEAGDYAPSVYLALRVARALHTSVEELFAPADTLESPHRLVRPAGEQPQAPADTPRSTSE